MNARCVRVSRQNERSASLAVDGRRIPTGMRTKQISMTGGTPTLSFALSHLSQFRVEIG
jgi:hypothetical protein